jgi:hypothetical protein
VSGDGVALPYISSRSVTVAVRKPF